jgi:hypothetical protein
MMEARACLQRLCLCSQTMCWAPHVACQLCARRHSAELSAAAPPCLFVLHQLCSSTCTFTQLNHAECVRAALPPLTKAELILWHGK